MQFLIRYFYTSLDFTNENHYTYPNGVIGSLQFQNKVLLILTATLAIILFVIIIDMSITALQVSVPVPPFKDEDTDKN